MDRLDSTVQDFDNTVKGWLSFVDNNEYISAAIALFLIVYASYAAPKLPPAILKLFDNPLFKLLIFFLIVYIARKSPTVAIIAAVGLMVTIHALNKFKINQSMMSMLCKHEKEKEREKMTNARRFRRDRIKEQMTDTRCGSMKHHEEHERDHHEEHERDHHEEHERDHHEEHERKHHGEHERKHHGEHEMEDHEMVNELIHPMAHEVHPRFHDVHPLDDIDHDEEHPMNARRVRPMAHDSTQREKYPREHEMTVEDDMKNLMGCKGKMTHKKKHKYRPPTHVSECSRTANFRNSFYPQYVDMKPDAYLARYTGTDVNGYDPHSKLASI
jgi:hypothetical protein